MELHQAEKHPVHVDEKLLSQCRHDLLVACRALSNMKLSAGPFGNVSVRIPNTPYYLENPADIYFENLRESDFVLLSVTGEKIAGKGERHQGDYIHQAIYRRRPDVGAIVHTHAHHSVLMACRAQLPAPWTQVGAAFVGDIGVYDGFSGPVRDQSEGEYIAKALGDKSVVMAVRHGFFIARKKLPEALWDMSLIEQVCREHLDMLRFGEITPSELPADALEKSARCIRHEFVEAFWSNLLQSRLGA